ncbi:DUF916 domain-containing protein [Enterococcus sp. HY326]|uniref:DUF916 domain-containing protein n=1 Tax=Enterococcus sp. HY326 TaxID=2971265 RepID=UPI00223F8A06|nr:DUF916 domain-containing protein [Enterococcus sp. HY326]
MKKKFWCRIFLALLLCCSLVVSSQRVFATSSGLNLLVSPLLPDNQLTAKVNYFDLLLKKEEEQTVTVVLNNPTDQDRVVAIEVNPATTTYNGTVEYEDKEPNEDLVPFNICDAVEVEERIELPANQTIDVPVTIKMPDVAFDGVVAGGLKLREITEETAKTETSAESTDKATDDRTDVTTEDSTTESTFAEESRESVVTNTYTYVIALLLSQNKAAVAPEITLGGMSLKNVKNQDAISLELVNEANAYAQDVRVEATISLEGGDESFTSEQSNMKIAPASIFNYPVEVESDLLAGDYLVETIVYSEKAKDGAYEASDGERYIYRFELSQTFTLDERIIQGNSDAGSFIPKNHNWMYWVGFVSLAGSFAGVAFYLQHKKLGAN